MLFILGVYSFYTLGDFFFLLQHRFFISIVPLLYEWTCVPVQVESYPTILVGAEIGITHICFNCPIDRANSSWILGFRGFRDWNQVKEDLRHMGIGVLGEARLLDSTSSRRDLRIVPENTSLGRNVKYMSCPGTVTADVSWQVIPRVDMLHCAYAGFPVHINGGGEHRLIDMI